MLLIIIIFLFFHGTICLCVIGIIQIETVTFANSLRLCRRLPANRGQELSFTVNENLSASQVPLKAVKTTSVLSVNLLKLHGCETMQQLSQQQYVLLDASRLHEEPSN